MITGHVFIAVSLDGFIARLDGDLDWLMKQKTSGEDHGYDAMIASVDGLIMGRHTYEKVLTFGDWPYSKPVVVLSRILSPDDLPTHLAGKVRLMNASPAQAMVKLAQDGWKHAYIDGGKLIQSFINEHLIADMVLTRIPILLGEGLPLFGALNQDIDLEHLHTKSFPSGLVTSKYRIATDAI